MPSNRRIRVMISSRCRDLIELHGKQVELTALRREIKNLITNNVPFGSSFFECWINEDSPATEGTVDSWEACLQQVRRADILLVLYNGNPGWAKEAGGVGICHAEFETGLATGAAKVFVIELPESEIPPTEEDASRYERFRSCFSRQNPFVRKAKDGDAVLEAIPEILHEALAELITLGGREARKGRFDTGNALDWNHLNFEDRKIAIELVVRDVLTTRENSHCEDDRIYIRINKTNLLCLVRAIPAAVTNAAAREMVGRPFHNDYKLATALGQGKGGPIHIIACHRGITEKQAADFLGQPDVVTVDSSFGVLAIDRPTKVQCIFLRNCRDETSTRHAVQRFFDWLARSGEDQPLADRGVSRARIVKAIANENTDA